MSFSQKGFSVMELIVAMAITACLALFAGACYQVVREKGERTSCLARMGNLSKALLLYTQEHGGKFPKSGHSGFSWAKSVAPYLEEPDLVSPTGYSVRNVFACPSWQRTRREENTTRWSYAVNVFFELTSAQRYTAGGLPIMSRDSYEGSPATWHRLNAIDRPARTILLAENRTAADHVMAHQWRTTRSAQETLAPKQHDTGCHMAFVDGHIELLQPEQTFDPASEINLWHPAKAR